jgi:hypothetical protein
MGQISKYREQMNLVFQQGICISPPFPHNETICGNVSTNRKAYKQNLQTVKELGYHEEMHIFEYMDYTQPHLNSAEDLKLQFQLRQQRLQNLTHDWDEGELKVIMKPIEEMFASGGYE